MTARGRGALHRAKIRAPVVGALFTKIAVSRFANTLATTLGAGVDMISSIRLAGAATGNAHFARSTNQVADDVSMGMDLSSALTRTRLFPPLLVRMAAVGERAGALSDMLDKASRFFDREVRASVAGMITLCETAITLTMGMAVALVALSVFMPLYKMMALVRR
jgi:type IV pilus assembly protein PilC